MAFTIVQAVMILFALFAWSRAFLRMYKKDINVAGFLAWSLLWIMIIIFAIFPNMIIELSTLTGIGRGVDVLMYLSIIVMFYLLFRLYVKVDGQTKEMTKIVREIAIRDAKKKR